MKATVTYPYRDRETGEVRLVGQVVEMTAERFRELSRNSFVGECAPEAEEAEEAPADKRAPEAKAATAAPEPTAAQLRAAIEAKGGFAPKKATKAQLASILGSL